MGRFFITHKEMTFGQQPASFPCVHRNLHRDIIQAKEHGGSNITWLSDTLMIHAEVVANNMRIIVDADACPVTKIIRNIALKYSVECILVCDEAHELFFEGVSVIQVATGSNSADYAIFAMLRTGDIVITNDMGLAVMCDAKHATVITFSGILINSRDIDTIINRRALFYLHYKMGLNKSSNRGGQRPNSQQASRAHFRTTLNSVIAERRAEEKKELIHQRRLGEDIKTQQEILEIERRKAERLLLIEKVTRKAESKRTWQDRAQEKRIKAALQKKNQPKEQPKDIVDAFFMSERELKRPTKKLPKTIY